MPNTHLNDLFRDTERTRVFWHTVQQPMSVLRLSLEEPEALIPTHLDGPITSATLLPFRVLAAKGALFMEQVRFLQRVRDLPWVSPRNLVDLREITHQSLTFLYPLINHENLTWLDSVSEPVKIKGDGTLIKLVLKTCIYLCSTHGPHEATWSLKIKNGTFVFKLAHAKKTEILDEKTYQISEIFHEENPVIAEAQWFLWAIHEIVCTLHLGTMKAYGTLEDITSIEFTLPV